MSMRIQNRVAGQGVILVLLFALVTPVAIWAQPAPPPTPSFEERARKKTTLDRESKEVADEYADILVELQTLIADYREYLSESDSKTITKYLAKLDNLNANLDRRLYVKDRDQLVIDLTAHVEDLEKIEQYIEESEEIFPIRILKLVSSLGRDFSNINDLLQDDLVERLAEVRANQKDLQATIDELLDGMLGEERGGHPVIVTVPRINEKAIQEIQEQAEAMANQAAKLAEKSAKAKSKSSSKSGESPIVIDLSDFDESDFDWAGSGTSKNLEANLQVTNPRLPIRINNQLGAVTVSGTTSKQIIAKLTAEISADSRSQEKKLLSEIELTLESVPGGYAITATAPQQGKINNDCRIISNSLEVLLPSSNPVVVNSSFGSVTVADLNSGVEIQANYAPVEVDAVKGGVTVSNNMGQIELMNCSGPIRVKNGYAPILLEGCTGQLNIENSYSEVGLDGCSGETVVRNSGVVKVSDHTGNVRISNSFGPIDVDGLAGNLIAANQFQPLSVRDIKGTVSVENANSNIDLANISGQLTATNKFGLIQAEDLAGPVHLNNQNGNIYLEMDDRFKGSSWVSTSFGNVELIISERSNFWVKAKTTFGEIVSDIPLKLDDFGTGKSGSFKLGRASDSLTINGQNTTITISGSK